MTTSLRATVAVDAMGGDHAPSAVLEGVDIALAADSALCVALVGQTDVVEPFAAERPAVEALAAPEVIGMHEHPANAVRAKRDSSIVVGCDAVRDCLAGAFFSAGNTGAVMAAATLRMGRLAGVSRPALAAILPFSARPVVFLDVGAQADVKAENLLHFGHMGAAYAECVLGRPEPTVALLNIGEEPGKGSQIARDAHALMAEGLPRFAGNVEGHDLVGATADVVVTDGFTGNVCLKLFEGYTSWLFGEIKTAVASSPTRKAAAGVLKPALDEMRRRLDPDAYGGVPLLGVAGVCLIGHGGSSPRAVASGIQAAAQAVRGGLIDAIATSLAEAPDA